MIARTITGFKVRETRRTLGLKQNELARRVGISASYLNLIERNKRAIGGALLTALGRELGLSVDELDGSAEWRLRDQLVALMEDPAAGGEAIPVDEADAIIARHPAWARGAVRLHAAYQAAEAEVEALSDRLTHDPVLAETIHAMLTGITALRSTVEILADPGEIDPAQRSRFEGIVDEQSGRLARTAAALAAHFDRMSEARRPRTAVEEAEEFLHRSDAADRVEDAAERLRADLLAGGRDLEAALAAALPRPPAVAPEWGRSERLAARALAWAGQTAMPEIEAALAGCPAAAEPFARALMAQRLADAARLPAPGFLGLGRRLNGTSTRWCGPPTVTARWCSGGWPTSTGPARRGPGWWRRTRRASPWRGAARSISCRGQGSSSVRSGRCIARGRAACSRRGSRCRGARCAACWRSPDRTAWPRGCWFSPGISRWRRRTGRRTCGSAPDVTSARTRPARSAASPRRSRPDFPWGILREPVVSSGQCRTKRRLRETTHGA